MRKAVYYLRYNVASEKTGKPVWWEDDVYFLPKIDIVLAPLIDKLDLDRDIHIAYNGAAPMEKDIQKSRLQVVKAIEGALLKHQVFDYIYFDDIFYYSIQIINILAVEYLSQINDDLFIFLGLIDEFLQHYKKLTKTEIEEYEISFEWPQIIEEHNLHEDDILHWTKAIELSITLLQRAEKKYSLDLSASITLIKEIMTNPEQHTKIYDLWKNLEI